MAIIAPLGQDEVGNDGQGFVVTVGEGDADINQMFTIHGQDGPTAHVTGTVPFVDQELNRLMSLPTACGRPGAACSTARSHTDTRKACAAA